MALCAATRERRPAATTGGNCPRFILIVLWRIRRRDFFSLNSCDSSLGPVDAGWIHHDSDWRCWLALQAPIRRLVWFGIALTSLGAVCFFVGEKMQFGFDDPGILFILAITITTVNVGILFLLSAGIRHLRAPTKTSKLGE
jgi:hypothetical protein